MSGHPIREYLQSKGKRTKEFLEDIDRAITLEGARQRENQPEAPPWNVLFWTAEEFDKADRVSRLARAESLIEYCREVILERAEGILAEKGRQVRRS